RRADVAIPKAALVPDRCAARYTPGPTPFHLRTDSAAPRRQPRAILVMRRVVRKTVQELLGRDDRDDDARRAPVSRRQPQCDPAAGPWRHRRNSIWAVARGQESKACSRGYGVAGPST